MSSKVYEPYQLGRPEEPYKPVYEPGEGVGSGGGLPANHIIVFAVAGLLAAGLVIAVIGGYYLLSSGETVQVTVDMAGNSTVGADAVVEAEESSTLPETPATVEDTDTTSALVTSTTAQAVSTTVGLTSSTVKVSTTTLPHTTTGPSCGSIKNANGASDCAKGTCQTPGMACRYVPGSIYTQGSCGCRRV